MTACINCGHPEEDHDTTAVLCGWLDCTCHALVTLAQPAAPRGNTPMRNLRLDNETWERIGVAAALDGTSRSELMRAAIAAYLSDTSALDEARMWARHGYELGQRFAYWTDPGTAPEWLTQPHEPNR